MRLRRAVRRFTRKSDGGMLREKLLSLADDTRSLTYNILVSPMPVANYMAGMRFTPITMGGGTFAEWWAVFDVTSGPPQVTADDIGDNVFVVCHAGVALDMFQALADKNINILVISTSEIKISVLIAEEYTELAVRALHSAFELEKA